MTGLLGNPAEKSQLDLLMDEIHTRMYKLYFGRNNFGWPAKNINAIMRVNKLLKDLYGIRALH